MAPSTVPLWLSLALAFAFLFPAGVILLLVFSLILLRSLAREHLALHRHIHAALLGHQEVLDLPGHAAISQHENDPVGTHHESTEWEKKETKSRKMSRKVRARANSCYFYWTTKGSV